ncbi:DUF4421 domain-containing protein [Rhodonellum sp.]|uniref:DUF4421 domain-containing protein n=1 Tax=Rhodonellum sp. TaxID=2231180 RepID=UPI0027238943|nr:DUF4421 domain-containing protein [Rhodonellum sp.]MDO9553131.1 DUF4421 domain-containing protein [Rhodonellum sp.]
MVKSEGVFLANFFLKKCRFEWQILSLFSFFFGVGSSDVLAQVEEDSAYYTTFQEKLTTRIYTSRKFTSFLIKDKVANQDYRFDPNSTLNLGLGLTYQGLTLNLAYGFSFLNPEIGKGSSKYMDLQTHIYPKNWVMDVFLQFYKGYHLAEKGLGASNPELYYQLPEMRVRKVGANVQYLFNGDQISLRAAFLQSEWQKKSAGSFLAGMEVYGGGASNSEGILPDDLVSPGRNFNEFRFFQFGPNAGYVHTLVIKKHFFITGSASTNLNLAYNSIQYPDQKSHSWGVNSNLFLRGYVGYNSEKWSINTNYVHNSVKLLGVEDFNNRFNTGNYRINFIYRFTVGPKLKPYLDYLDLKRYL